MIIKVGSDLDGVLVPLFETALPFLNGRFNTNISLEQVTSHDVSPVFGVSQQVLYEVLCDFYKTDEFKKM
ncbi:MAG: hypothetical protein WCK90_05820, partial [archaeon]